MAQHDSPEGPLLDSIVADDESSITTHLRALGISSSGVIRGAVQFGSNQVINVAQMFASLMSFMKSFRFSCLCS